MADLPGTPSLSSLSSTMSTASLETTEREAALREEIRQFYFRKGFYIDQTTFQKCHQNIKKWINLTVLVGYLMQNGIVNGPDEMNMIQSPYFDGAHKLKNLFDLTEKNGGRNGYFLLYKCLCESRAENPLGHGDVIDELERYAAAHPRAPEWLEQSGETGSRANISLTMSSLSSNNTSSRTSLSSLSTQGIDSPRGQSSEASGQSVVDHGAAGQLSNYGPPQSSNHGTPQPSNYGPPQSSNHGTPQPSNYGPPQSSNYGPPQPTNYRPPQPSNNSPLQPSNSGPQGNTPPPRSQPQPQTPSSSQSQPHITTQRTNSSQQGSPDVVRSHVQTQLYQNPPPRSSGNTNQTASITGGSSISNTGSIPKVYQQSGIPGLNSNREGLLCGQGGGAMGGASLQKPIVINKTTGVSLNSDASSLSGYTPGPGSLIFEQPQSETSGEFMDVRFQGGDDERDKAFGAEGQALELPMIVTIRGLIASGDVHSLCTKYEDTIDTEYVPSDVCTNKSNFMDAVCKFVCAALNSRDSDKIGALLGGVDCDEAGSYEVSGFQLASSACPGVLSKFYDVLNATLVFQSEKTFKPVSIDHLKRMVSMEFMPVKNSQDDSEKTVVVVFVTPIWELCKDALYWCRFKDAVNGRPKPCECFKRYEGSTVTVKPHKVTGLENVLNNTWGKYEDSNST